MYRLVGLDASAGAELWVQYVSSDAALERACRNWFDAVRERPGKVRVTRQDGTPFCTLIERVIVDKYAGWSND